MLNGFPYLTDVRYHALVLFAAAITALMCLVALWAAKSRRHWFIRFAAVWTGLAILVPVRAHEPIVVYAIAMAGIVAIRCALVRGHRVQPLLNPVEVPIASANRGARYSLANLFLSVTAIAMSLGLAIPVVKADVPWGLIVSLGMFASGIWISNTANLAAMVLSKRHRAYRWATLTAAAIILGFGPFVLCSSSTNWLHIDYLFDVWPRSYMENYLLVFLLLLEITGCIVVGLLAMRAFTVGRLAASDARLARCGALSGLIILALPILWLYWQMLGGQRNPHLPAHALDEANAFPKIVAAIRTRDVGQDDSATIDDIERWARQPGHVDLEALRAAYRHLDRQEEAKNLRTVERLFADRSDGAQQRGEIAKAADYALLNVFWGDQLGHQGHAFHSLVGAAAENVGIHKLASLRGNLTADQRRQIVADLARVDANREPLAELIARDNAWEDANLRWKHRLERILLRQIWGRDSGTSGVSEHLDRALLRRDTLVRLMMTDLTLRAFQADRGRLPETLDQLVPDLSAGAPPRSV